jgi:hypothetical protein
VLGQRVSSAVTSWPRGNVHLGRPRLVGRARARVPAIFGDDREHLRAHLPPAESPKGALGSWTCDSFPQAWWWEVRGVGQGWDSGLGGLATAYGIAVEDLARRGVPIVKGEIVDASLDDGAVAVSGEATDRAALEQLRGDGVSMVIGPVPALPHGFGDLHFRAVRRSVAGQQRVVGLEAYDADTNEPTGLVGQGAAMPTEPFRKGPNPFVEDRGAFATALRERANAADVSVDWRGVESSICQSATNVPLSKEPPS